MLGVSESTLDKMKSSDAKRNRWGLNEAADRHHAVETQHSNMPFSPRSDHGVSGVSSQGSHWTASQGSLQGGASAESVVSSVASSDRIEVDLLDADRVSKPAPMRPASSGGGGSGRGSEWEAPKREAGIAEGDEAAETAASD